MTMIIHGIQQQYSTLCFHGVMPPSSLFDVCFFCILHSKIVVRSF